MLILISFVLLTYAVCIFILNKGYNRVQNKSAEEHEAFHSFSILIPFHNEEKHLTQLCESLSKLEYPIHLFELIFIDDFSTDQSVALIENFNFPDLFSVKVLSSVKKSAAPKKDALQIGISQARFNWIVTTDADCVCPELWLKAINDFIEIHHPKMLCGSVLVVSNNDEIQELQQMENLSLQFVTRAAIGWKKPIMANGANLIYRKDAFYGCGGFEGNLDIASGDDIFLMEKFRQRDPDGIHYLADKRAIVRTQPVTSWKEVVHQRVRWASKTRKQKNNLSILIGGLVTLANLMVLVCVVLFFLDDIPKIILLGFFIFKILIDFWTVRRSANFFEQQTFFIKFIYLNLIYTFLQIFVFFKTLKSSYIWKNNQFKT